MGILPEMATSNSGHPRRTRGSLSREEILEAALTIIQDEGLEKLSMRRIAHVLQCSVASPYAYFESQEAIIQSLIINGEQQLTQMLRDAVAGRKLDVYSELEILARTYWEFATTNRELHKLMINMGLYRKSFHKLPTSFRVFLEALRRGINNGEIKYPSERYRAIASTLWAWIYGLIVLDMTDLLRTGAGGNDPIGDGIEFFKTALQSGTLRV